MMALGSELNLIFRRFRAAKSWRLASLSDLLSYVCRFAHKYLHSILLVFTHQLRELNTKQITIK